jgi:hypothetical protein
LNHQGGICYLSKVLGGENDMEANYDRYKEIRKLKRAIFYHLEFQGRSSEAHEFLRMSDEEFIRTHPQNGIVSADEQLSLCETIVEQLNGGKLLDEIASEVNMGKPSLMKQLKQVGCDVDVLIKKSYKKKFAPLYKEVKTIPLRAHAIEKKYGIPFTKIDEVMTLGGCKVNEHTRCWYK